MTDRFLLDTVTLGRLMLSQRASPFVRQRCRIPTAILAEARGLRDHDLLVELEYPTDAEVLRKVMEVVRSLAPDDRLLDLYTNQGNGDIFLLAVALVEADVATLQLFSDRWVIATDDARLIANAREWSVATCTPNQFAAHIE